MSIPLGTFVVIARQGAGKTRNAEQLARLLGCTRIVDDWDGVSPLPSHALALTNARRVTVSSCAEHTVLAAMGGE